MAGGKDVFRWFTQWLEGFLCYAKVETSLSKKFFSQGFLSICLIFVLVVVLTFLFLCKVHMLEEIAFFKC